MTMITSARTSRGPLSEATIRKSPQLSAPSPSTTEKGTMRPMVPSFQYDVVHSAPPENTTTIEYEALGDSGTCQIGKVGKLYRPSAAGPGHRPRPEQPGPVSGRGHNGASACGGTHLEGSQNAAVAYRFLKV